MFTRRRDGTWQDAFEWSGRKLYVIAGGDEAGPDPALEATARAVVTRFGEVALAIEAFAAGLLPDGRVPFAKRPIEGFKARICGFAPGELWFDGVTALDAALPGRADVPFVTGLPDGHVSYRAILEDGRPIEIVADV